MRSAAVAAADPLKRKTGWRASRGGSWATSVRTFVWCGACEVYTLRLYRDVFVGPETARDSEPISKEEGDRRLAAIRSCPEPYDGRCRCDGHRAYFGDWLD
jgi:hypothetical protein